MAYNYDEQATEILYTNRLEHHGILGQRWGQRRYQNIDGSLTQLGRKRYGVGERLHPIGRLVTKGTHVSKLRDEEAAYKNRLRIVSNKTAKSSDTANRLKSKQYSQERRYDEMQKLISAKQKSILDNRLLSTEEKQRRLDRLADSYRKKVDRANERNTKLDIKASRAEDRAARNRAEYDRVLNELKKYPDKVNSVMAGEPGYDFYMKRKVGKYISKTGTTRYGIYKTVVTRVV